MENNKITREYISKLCNTLGMGLFIMALTNMGCQFLIIELLNKINPEMNNILKVLISNSIGFYLIGLLIFKYITRKIPIIKSRDVKIYNSLELIELSLLSIGVMYMSNFIGLIVTSILGIESPNPVDLLVTGSGIDNILFLFVATCILAPVFEELLFRSWILGKLKILGSKPAIIISAILFALYHMNIVQGIYAFGIGIILGCITIRSGNIKTAIIIHGIVNFVGGIIMPILVGVFPEISIPNGEIIVTSLVLWFLICGSIIFFRKKEVLLFSEELKGNTQSEASFSAININQGMILFYSYCIIMSVKYIMTV